MAIEVNKNSWHFKVYRWWYQQKFGATKSGNAVRDENGNLQWDYERHGILYEQISNEPERTNLCPYMRAILFWSWMRAIFLTNVKGMWLLTWYGFGAALVVLGGLAAKHPWDVLKVLGFIVVGAIGGLLMALLLNSFKTKPMQRLVANGEEFNRLVKEYVRAKHDRICPEIIVKGSN